MEFFIVCLKIFAVVFAVVSGFCLPVALGMIFEKWMNKNDHS